MQHLSVRAKRPVTVKRLFLAVPLHKRSARILSRLFWISFGLLLIVSTTVTAELANNGKEIGEEITGVITLAVITVGLRAWVARTNIGSRPRASPGIRVSTPTRRPPWVGLSNRRRPFSFAALALHGVWRNARQSGRRRRGDEITQDLDEAGRLIELGKADQTR